MFNIEIELTEKELNEINTILLKDNITFSEYLNLLIVKDLNKNKLKKKYKVVK